MLIMKFLEGRTLSWWATFLRIRSTEFQLYNHTRCMKIHIRIIK
jgi:hypothetical protein